MQSIDRKMRKPAKIRGDRKLEKSEREICRVERGRMLGVILIVY